MGVGFIRTNAEIAAGVTPTEYAYPPLDVRRYGAVGDAVTDDTAAIQRAINVAMEYVAVQGGAEVYVPPAQSGGYYRVTGAVALTMNGLGVAIRGDGCGSVIYNTTSGGITLDIGDNITESDNNKVIGLNLGGVGGAGSIAIRARLCPNIDIQRCNIQGVEDGIRATGVYCGRITGNTMGGITGYGMHLTASANAMQIMGNRIDGANIAATCGILIAGTGNEVIANTIETFDTCVNIVGCRGNTFHNYMETYRIGYSSTLGLSEACSIGGEFESLDAEHSIYLAAGIGWRIDNCNFTGAHTTDAPIELTSGPGKVFIGPNITHDDSHIVDWPINHLALNQHLLSDNMYPAAPGYLTPVTHTGTTTETAIGPGYTATRQNLGVGSRIRVRAAGRCINNNSTKNVRLKLAGTTIATMSQLAAGVADWQIEANIDIGSSTVAVGTVEVLINGSATLFDVLNSGVTIALATTNPVVTLTAQLGSTSDSVTLNVWEVQVLN